MQNHFSPGNRIDSVFDSVCQQTAAEFQSEWKPKSVGQILEYSKIIFVPDLPNNSFDVYHEDTWLGSAFPYCERSALGVRQSLCVRWCFVDSKHGQIYHSNTLERLKYRIDIAYWVK